MRKGIGAIVKAFTVPGYAVKSALMAACVLLLGAGLARATTVMIPTDDDMIVGARSIVRANVISVGSADDGHSAWVCTYIKLRVLDVLKGPIATRDIVIKEPGGQIASRGSVIFGTPQFTAGEQVILFLDTWPDGSLRVHNIFLGKYSVIKDSSTGQTTVVRDTPGPNVEVLIDKSNPPQSTSTSRMELSAFTHMVRKKLAANWTQSVEFEARYYPGVPQLIAPPEYEPKAAEGKIEAQFHLFNPAVRHFEPDSGQPVVYQVNPAGAPSTQIMDDVGAAMNAWSSVPGCSLRVTSGGTTSACPSGFGVNLVYFSNCDGLFSPGPCGGAGGTILAEGGFAGWDPSQTKVVNGTSFIRIEGAFISFSPYATCFFGDHCNVREVVTHEMGHSLGLHHSWEPSFGGSPTALEQDATMFYIAHFDGRCASVKTDDINGIVFVYPGQAAGGPLTITTTAVPTAFMGTAYSALLIAAGGTAPYTWGLAPGSAAPPPGLGVTSNGTIAGTPTASSSSTFTVQVADAAGHTAQQQFSISVFNPGSGPLSSQFVRQTVPARLLPGQVFAVSVSWVNNGTTPWSTSTLVSIGTQNPANNLTWGGDRVLLNSVIITQGQEFDATFQAVAPVTPGIYNFQLQMIKEDTGFFGDKSPNVAINVQPVSIDTAPVLSGSLGSPFNQQLAASGGQSPYTWSLIGGSLAAGLNMNSSGLISGVPSTAGTTGFTVLVSDANANAAQKAFSIIVGLPSVAITTSSIPTAVAGSTFSQQMMATGGVPPYTWTIASGTLPPQLGINTAAGVIFGTPTTAGTFNFTVSATDATPSTVTKPLTLVVVSPNSVPHIDNVKYKSGPEKLIVIGANFDPSVMLAVDGTQVPVRFVDSTYLIVKPLVLGSGTHVVVVTNPNGVSSSQVAIRVN
ncbi:MAG TPA: putative Ig domain-containing protein [Blastocatellia bacterium]|nr:putative Ig domain-containing protein [Blastocatellia bacterium]